MKRWPGGTPILAIGYPQIAASPNSLLVTCPTPVSRGFQRRSWCTWDPAVLPGPRNTTRGGSPRDQAAASCFVRRMEHRPDGPRGCASPRSRCPGVRRAGRTCSSRLALLPNPPRGAEQRWPALAVGRGCDTRNNDWLEMFNVAEGTCGGRTFTAPGPQMSPARPATLTGRDSQARSPSLDLRIRGAAGTRPPEPWDEAAARRAEVTGEPLRRESLARDLRNPTAEQFDALWNIRERSVYPLRRFLGGRTVRRSFAEAQTADGLTVRVERDSLPYALPPAKAADLPAAVEITKVSFPRSRPIQPAAAPLAAGQLGSLLPGPVGPRSTLNTVIVTAYWGTGGIPDRYDVWLDTPTGPVPHELPAGCFTLSPRRVGETCTGILTPNGWEFTPTGRAIYARALHQRESTDIRPDRAWHCIGWFRTGYWLCVVRPAGRRPAGDPATAQALRIPPGPARHRGRAAWRRRPPEWHPTYASAREHRIGQPGR